MKNATKFLVITVLGLAFSASTFAQVTATATATANIVAPIAIANATDMNFGNVAVSGAPGTVVLDPAGTRTRTGGVTLPAVGGTVTAATFNVTGNGSATYTIAVTPASVVINNGATTMAVGSWVTNPNPTGLLSGGGAQTVQVGATLSVNGGQLPGTYTTVPGNEFSVTVNYN